MTQMRQRFASSSYEQWVKIEKSFDFFWKAFDLLHPNRAEDEEWQYMIAGSDFVHDLLALLDILSVTLLPGWLVTSDGGRDSGEDRFSWTQREQHEMKEDHRRFAKDLKDSLEKRVTSILHSEMMSHLEVFDAANLVKLHCGTAEDGKITFFLPEGEIEEYGVEECKEVMKVASKLSHIQASGLNFDTRMAHAYMGLLKKAVLEAKKIRAEESTNLESIFVMRFSNEMVRKVRLSEKCVYTSFYSNKVLYDIAQPPPCALLDIVLAKGGPEAIAESFYNTMRNQQQSGGQSNDTLARRTKVNWCLPSLKHCEKIIKEGVRLYLEGGR
ncbi:Hypothetical predicted protein [Paramuricea clavata]|uniref:Uncharacterized protein n=1 Tax=Paramuricea clavata TaxID=317549 RepID=A0A6S7JPJ7_PARCT|nr:Hypothetical predicted protein [Paramuricea clavata]